MLNTLMILADERANPLGKRQTKEDLKIVIRKKKLPGPDNNFDELFRRLGPTKVVITYLLWKDRIAFCQVNVPNPIKKIIEPLHLPQMTLITDTRLPNDCADENARSICCMEGWVSEKTGEEINPQTGWRRKRLNYDIMTEPTVHLKDKDS